MTETGWVRATEATASEADDDVTCLHEAVMEAERAVRGQPRSEAVREALREALDAEGRALQSLGFRTYDDYVNATGVQAKELSEPSEAPAESESAPVESAPVPVDRDELQHRLEDANVRLTAMQAELAAHSEARQRLMSDAEERNAALVRETSGLISSVERLEHQLSERVREAEALRVQVAELQTERATREAELKRAIGQLAILERTVQERDVAARNFAVARQLLSSRTAALEATAEALQQLASDTRAAAATSSKAAPEPT